MSWIESHQSIATHPKLYRLSVISGYDPDICIAKLHRLWWWALQYAEDGDLNGFSDEEIGYGMSISDMQNGKNFVAALRTAGWIDDKTNYIHDWFDYTWRYLYSKYHDSNPKRYQQIKKKWRGRPKVHPKVHPKGLAETETSYPLVSQPNLPNQPDQPNPKNPPLPPQKEGPAFLPENPKPEERDYPDFGRKLLVYQNRILSKYNRFLFNKFLSDCIRSKFHPKAILISFDRLLTAKETINKPESYCYTIAQRESGNLHEDEAIKKHKEIMATWADCAKDFFQGVISNEK